MAGLLLFTLALPAHADPPAPPPRAGIHLFHGALARAGVTGSGVFADGHLTREARLLVGPTRPGDVVTIEGSVPRATVLRIGLGSDPEQYHALSRGSFRLMLRPNVLPPSLLVRLRFPTEVTLPYPDLRRVAGRLERLEVAPFTIEPVNFDTPMLGPDPRLELRSIDADGWVDREAVIIFPVTLPDSRLLITLAVPGPPELRRRPVTVRVNGTTVVSTPSIAAGSVRLQVPLRTADGRPPDVTLRAGHPFHLMPPDPRVRSFRLLRLELESP